MVLEVQETNLEFPSVEFLLFTLYELFEFCNLAHDKVIVCCRVGHHRPQVKNVLPVEPPSVEGRRLDGLQLSKLEFLNERVKVARQEL